MLTRQEVFTCQPLLFPDKPVTLISGTDDDAMTATFLILMANPQAKLIGLYKDFNEILYGADYTEDDLMNSLWVDLDICHPKIQSLGHHMIRRDNHCKLNGFKNSININELFGKTRVDYENKYPYGTTHFILWLYNIHTMTYEEMCMYANADSLWINAQKYSNNANNWLKEFPNNLLDYIVKHSNDREFAAVMMQYQAAMRKEGILQGRTSENHKSTHLGLYGYRGIMGDYDTPEGYVNKMMIFRENVTKRLLKAGQIDLNWYKVAYGTRKNAQIFGNETVDFDEFLEVNNVFSYAFYQSGTFNYTIFENFLK